MKNLVFLLSLILIGTACSQPVKQPNNVQTQAVPAQQGKKYTCTMHPGVISSKPETCPECGMDLVEKE